MHDAAKTLSVAVLGLFVVSGCAAQPDRSAQSSQTGLEALIEAHDAAWNAHDPDAMTALYAESGTLVTPIGTRVVGHDALRKLFASPGPTKQTTSKTEIDAVQWLDDDVALLDARQTLSGPGVEIIGSSEAAAVLIVERRGDAWEIVAARPYTLMAHRPAGQ
jgi:uncharacterized protein (TIGR02246 family)